MEPQLAAITTHISHKQSSVREESRLSLHNYRGQRSNSGSNMEAGKKFAMIGNLQ